jgi:hypothetical protein
VKLYAVIVAVPPAPGVNGIESEAIPGVAWESIGALGRVVIEFEIEDGSEYPTELCEVTVNVYSVFAVKPVMRIVPLPDWARTPDPEFGCEEAE